MANVYVWADVYECEGAEHPARNPNYSVFTECVRREDYDALLARVVAAEGLFDKIMAGQMIESPSCKWMYDEISQWLPVGHRFREDTESAARSTPGTPATE